MKDRILFLIGWILSPFTFWNDAFVNLPLSYLLASVTARFFRVNFLYAVLVFYWLSNLAGIWLMYAAGRGIINDRKSLTRALADLFATMAIYSVIVVAIDRLGILKPIWYFFANR